MRKPVERASSAAAQNDVGGRREDRERKDGREREREREMGGGHGSGHEMLAVFTLSPPTMSFSPSPPLITASHLDFWNVLGFATFSVSAPPLPSLSH